MVAYRKEGTATLAHGNRGRKPSHNLDALPLVYTAAHMVVDKQEEVAAMAMLVS